MAVTFSGNTLDFSTSVFSTLTTYTFLVCININSYNANSSRFIRTGESSTNKLVYFGLGGTASEVIFFSRPDGSSNPGLWTTTTDPAPISTNLFLAVTYDNSSTSNDPIIYVNGASQTISESSAPLTSGAIATANYINLSTTGTNSFDGTLRSVCIYNRILSASEIADAYASKLAIPTTRGLIFAPQLWGCAGGVAEGGTMAAGNTVADTVSGALGVPSGSPVFKGDTVLTFQS